MCSWRAFFFKAIGSIDDAFDILKIFSDPFTHIIGDFSDESYRTISSYTNSFSEDSLNIVNPRMEITGNFCELTLTEVTSPCTDICYGISDKLIGIANKILNEILCSRSCRRAPAGRI